MLNVYFPSLDTRQQLCSGLVGPHLDGFAHSLHQAGYAPGTARIYLRAATHLGLWMEQTELALTRCDKAAVEQFQQHLPTCRCPGRSGSTHGNAVFGARRFLHYLRHVGVVPGNGTPAAPHEPLLLQTFRQWMEQHRGVTRSTLEVYGRTVTALLHTLGEAPAQFTAQGLRTFVLDQAHRHSPHHAKLVVTATRMFVRYLVAQGHCAAALADAIPTVAAWRLAVLPQYLPATDIARIIAACDPTTPTGARDQAIVLLLSRLGLRASDVTARRFQPIDWAAASLRVGGKGRRETCLPLPQDVGDAILTYLERGRPPYHDDHVFLRAIAPRGPLTRRAISNLIARAMRRAEVRAPSYGAHILRHSAATAIVRQGGSLDVIAAVLRHRSVETTVLYAKVDVALLHEVAQPWPEVHVC